MAETVGASATESKASSPLGATQHPSIRIIPQVTDTHRGLNFPIIEKKVPNGKVIHVKRFVEKGNTDFTDCITFKSKVVSRQHDTKSSSGTFINNVRISPANSESKQFQLKDGDIIQLGVDYQGRTEDIFRCVRMRVELNREAIKHRSNAFRNQVVKALRALASATDKDNTGSTGDCCICLGSIAPFQALFIAPCCHSFHFKCARPLLSSWPNFQCPLCRHFADLSSSVSVDDLGAWNDVPDNDKPLSSAETQAEGGIGSNDQSGSNSDDDHELEPPTNNLVISQPENRIGNLSIPLSTSASQSTTDPDNNNALHISSQPGSSQITPVDNITHNNNTIVHTAPSTSTVVDRVTSLSPPSGVLRVCAVGNGRDPEATDAEDEPIDSVQNTDSVSLPNTQSITIPPSKPTGSTNQLEGIDIALSTGSESVTNRNSDDIGRLPIQ